MTHESLSSPADSIQEVATAPTVGDADEAEPAPSTWRRFVPAAVAALLLAAATVAVYWQTLEADFGFVNYDDNLYVYDNVHVQGGLTPENVKWAITTTDTVNWYPLTWLSFELDSNLGGGVGRPFGFHLTNLILHAADTLLLFWALARMTGRVGRSAFVAALFALHPLHVESVAWVTERKDVLSGLFWMLAMLAYVRYAEKPTWIRYLLVVLAFAVGLTAKSMLVTLPAVFVLLDYWPLRRFPGMAPRDPDEPGCRPAAASWRRLVLEKLPLLALSAASTAITIYAQQKGGERNPLDEMPLRLGNAAVAYVTYVSKTLWPVGLVPFYPMPKAEGFSYFTAAEAGLLLLAVTVLVLAAARRRPYLTVGWLWFLGTLAPVIGIVQVIGGYSMADRFTYLPLIGLFLAAVWGAASAAERARVPPWVLVGVGAVLLGGFVAGTWQQVGYWHDSMALWQHTLQVNPTNHLAYNNIGNVLLREEKRDQAEWYFRKAIECDDTFGLAHFSLGWTLAEEGKADQALAEYEKAVLCEPTAVSYRCTLANALLSHGYVGRAVAEYQAVLAGAPEYSWAHLGLGNAYYQEGKYAEAQGEQEAALRLAPDWVDAHNALGQALLAQGNVDGAFAQFDEALRLDPNNADAHADRAQAFYRVGKALEGAEEQATADRLRREAWAKTGNP